MVENMDDLISKMKHIMEEKYDKSSLLALKEIEET